MLKEPEDPGWITSDEFDALAAEYERGRISNGEFIERIYANYNKVREGKIDLEKIKKECSLGTKGQIISSVIANLVLCGGFINRSPEESSNQKSVMRDNDLKKAADDALECRDLEAALKITLQLVGLLERRISAMEKKTTLWTHYGKNG